MKKQSEKLRFEKEEHGFMDRKKNPGRSRKRHGRAVHRKYKTVKRVTAGTRDTLYREASQNDEDENIAVTALQETTEAMNDASAASNPISRWQQKRKIKKDYEASVSAGRLQGTGTGKAVEKTTVNTTETGEKLLEKLKEYFTEKTGYLKFLLLALLLLLLVLCCLESCTTMFTGALSTITATSWPADDSEITKAEAYYVKLECELRARLDRIPREYPDSDEYTYDIGEIGHDPSVLISYLCAKYGGFQFSDIRKDIKKLFEEQYQLKIVDEEAGKTVKKKVNRGQSLGTVVTTGYCNCAKCCGKWAGGNTASGVPPTASHTIAVDSKTPIVPMGTEIIMDGVLYKVEDTGPLTKYGVAFDVFYDRHSDASAHGMKKVEAFYAGGSGKEIEVTTSTSIHETRVTLTSKDLESLCMKKLSEEEKEMYDVYQMTHGNRLFFESPVEYNWHKNILQSYGYYYDSGKQQVKESEVMILALPEGTSVQSIMDGRLKSVSGNKLVLVDEQGYEVTFSGLKNLTVQEGAEVTRGQKIGKVNADTKLSISLRYKGSSFNPYFYMDTGTEEIEAPGIIDIAGNTIAPNIAGIPNAKAKAVIAEASKYLGTPYVWGGYSPSGFDCSGFVSWSINHSGVMNIGRQYTYTLLPMCTQIPKSQLQPGDLVFFQGTYKSGLSHVGIYVGSGQFGAGTFIHSGDPCQYADLNSPYWIDHWLIGGRILN